MDYANERYVRVYTRDTTTWKCLDWKARTVLMHMFRKVDRQGVLPVGSRGTRGLAAILELPLELVNDAVPQLIAEEVMVQTEHAFVLPNYLEAQEAVQSTGHRSREYRERVRAAALAPVTKRDASVTKRDGSATFRDESSRDVTERHAASHSVTPILAEPNLTKPSSPSVKRAPAPPAPVAKARDEFNAYFLAVTGSGATWVNQQIGRLKTLIGTHGADEVSRRIWVLRTSPPQFPPQPWDVDTFLRNFDKCTGAKPVNSNGATGRVEPGAPGSYPSGRVEL